MNLSLKLKKVGRVLKRNAPTIISVASAGGVVVTGILAARAAYKTYPDVERHKEDIEIIRDNRESFGSKKDYNKAVAEVYFHAVKDCAKQYWLPVLSGGLTIAGVISSNRIMQRRLTHAGLALATMYASFAEYRKRVAEKYGENAELELRIGAKPTEVVETYTDKKGNEKTKVTTYIDPNEIPYSIDTLKLDSTWEYWRKDFPEMTKMTIESIQKALNERLHMKGFLTVNEVREAFEQDWDPYGQIVGWTDTPDNPDSDCAVDFGLRKGTNNYDDFMKGKNDFVVLTLNHDGLILDKIGDFNAEWRKNNFKRLRTF